MNALIPLSDKHYFELRVGKRILTKQLFKSKGTIPVYSGSVVNIRGYTNKSTLTDFDHDYIIWGIDDAVFDFNLIPAGTQFDITDHCGCIKIIDSSIYPEFICYQLQARRKEIAYNWAVRASMGRMKKIKVSIPISANGSFDLSKQQTAASRYRKVTQAIQRFEGFKNELKSINFRINIDDQNYIWRPVKELFDLTIPTNHGLTMRYVNEHKGNIPCYGASKDEDAVGYGYIADNLDGIKYFEDILTWNKDGSAGKVFHRKGRFSLSEKVVPLVFRQEYKDWIIPEYAKILIEQTALETGFYFAHKASKKKLAEMQIPIPIKTWTSTLNYDLIKQSQIIERHKQAEAIRSKILEYIEELTGSNSAVILED